MPMKFPELLDTDFDTYEQYEIDDMISAAKSGAVSTANEILYSVPTGKYYEWSWFEKKRREAEEAKWQKENPPPPPVNLNAREFYMSLLGVQTEKAKEILTGFAESRHNQKLFKKYTKKKGP